MTASPRKAPWFELVLEKRFMNPHEPEIRLMAAVLEDALHCLRKFRHSEVWTERIVYSRDVDWISSPDRRWPFSFENICEVLGLDAGLVRKQLRQYFPE